MKSINKKEYILLISIITFIMITLFGSIIYSAFDKTQLSDGTGERWNSRNSFRNAKNN